MPSVDAVLAMQTGGERCVTAFVKPEQLSRRIKIKEQLDGLPAKLRKHALVRAASNGDTAEVASLLDESGAESAQTGGSDIKPLISRAQDDLTPLRVKKTEQRAGTFVGFLTRVGRPVKVAFRN